MKKSILLSFGIMTLISLSACGSYDSGDSRTINVFINEGNLYEGSKKDSIWEKIERETNVTLELGGATHSSDYYLTLNPKLISPRNNLDIVFCVPSNSNCAYETAIDNDMYWNLDELLAMKPDTYNNIDRIIHSDVYKNIMYGDNCHTFVPFPSSRSGWTIYYRSDWLINIGYYTEVDGHKVAKTPETIKEFEDVMYKFRNNDPDGNGKKDTYGISPAGSYFYWNPLYHAFGVTPDYDLDDSNEATYMYTQDEFRDYLAWINKVYCDDVIDPNFASNSPNEGDRDKFYNGLVGILITNGESHVDWVIPGVEKIQGKGKVCIGSAPVGCEELGKPGVGGFSDWGGWWGGYSIFKHMINGTDYDYDSAYAALDLLDYLFSEEGGLLRTYGIENTHWQYGENGEIEPITYNRSKEADGTFVSVEQEDGTNKLTGLYKMGSSWGSRLHWNDDGTFECVIDSSNMPYNLKDIFDETVEKNTVVSSRLINFTCYASGYAQSMNLFEDEMERWAIAATRDTSSDKEVLNNWSGEDGELSNLINNYKWNKIKKMIKAQAKKGGLI